MTNEQQKVAEFHRAFLVESLTAPAMPSIEIRKLRAKLILEEAFETIDAMGVEVLRNQDSIIPLDAKLLVFCETIHNPSLKETSDGLADLLYVTLGTALACGIDLEPIFNEVHRSNMSKLWTDEEVATLPHGCKVIHSLAIGTPRRHVVKRSDGKVIKSPSYSKANL